MSSWRIGLNGQPLIGSSPRPLHSELAPDESARVGGGDNLLHSCKESDFFLLGRRANHISTSCCTVFLLPTDKRWDRTSQVVADGLDQLDSLPQYARSWLAKRILEGDQIRDPYSGVFEYLLEVYLCATRRSADQNTESF